MDSNLLAGRPAAAAEPQAPDSGEASVAARLRQFSGSHCSVFGSESMLRSSAYYAYTAAVTAGGGAMSVTPTSSSVPGEYRVRVVRVAPHSAAAGEASDDAATVVIINGERIECSSREYLYNGLLFFFTRPSPDGEDTVIEVSRRLDMSVRMIRRFTDELFALIGLLRADGAPDYARLASELERAFFARHPATGLAASDCGITPSGGASPLFDEEHVRESLEKSTEDVASLFSRCGDGDDAGIARRVKELIGECLWSDEGGDGAERLELRGCRLDETHSLSRLIEKQGELLSGLFDF